MEKDRIDLLYLAKPTYGGWVTFTVHLALSLIEAGYDVRLFKVGNKTEQKARHFGYGVFYVNINKGLIKKLHNPLITAVDKNYHQLLDQFDGAHLVIHDPTELKPAMVENLHRFRLITIRKTVQELLLKSHGKMSLFLPHPFYKYDIPECSERRGAVSTSRIDFDKNIDIILKANAKLKEPVELYGAENRLYTHFKLEELGFNKYYRGSFGKRFEDISRILNGKKYLVDMSAIARDGGGGTQYTFLEAFHQGVVPVLNSKWFENGTDVMKPGATCLKAGDENELVEVLEGDHDLNRIRENGKQILQYHELKEAVWLS